MKLVIESVWYKNKLTAILGMLIGLVLLASSYYHYQTAKEYNALPQQVILNVYNQPIGVQDLMSDTFHNPQYRRSTQNNGETPEDFLKDALLDMFYYTKEDLEDGEVLRRFQYWCYEEVAETLYKDVFVNLGQQRIVLAQNGLVDIRIIGDFTYVGKASRPYKSTSGLRLDSLTHKFEGRVVVTAYGEKEYPTMYTMTALVQRALLQDKSKGYHLVELELK